MGGCDLFERQASCQSWNCEEFNYSLKEPTVVSHFFVSTFVSFLLFFLKDSIFSPFLSDQSFVSEFFFTEKEILRESEIFVVNRSWKGTDQKFQERDLSYQTVNNLRKLNGLWLEEDFTGIKLKGLNLERNWIIFFLFLILFCNFFLLLFLIFSFDLFFVLFLV